MAHESEPRGWRRYVGCGDVRPGDDHGRVGGPSSHLRRDVGKAVDIVRGIVAGGTGADLAAAVLEQLASLQLCIALLSLPARTHLAEEARNAEPEEHR